jgi:hypothetical protein
MKHAAKLIINTEGEKDSYLLKNGPELYYEKLWSAYKDIEDDNTNDYSYFSFFILCAATLEYSLNFLITDYCIGIYGPKKSKPFEDGFTSLNFKKKILMTPSILTEGRLLFDQNSTTFKKLNELVSLRNKIMHGKEPLDEFKFPDLSDIDEEGITIKIETQRNPINKLDKINCLEFGQALRDFKNHIMIPWFNEEIEANDLLIINPIKHSFSSNDSKQ